MTPDEMQQARDRRLDDAELDAMELEYRARGRHPTANTMPPSQMRRDNQDYFDRIDPDRRRYRHDPDA